MYAIIDSNDQVLGEWFCGVHYVPVYGKRKDAQADSKEFPFRTSIIKAEIALRLKPSRHSKLISFS